MGRIIFWLQAISELFGNLFGRGGRNRLRAQLPTSLKGKVFLVTGASSGIGFETAKTLAKLDAIVIMGCRNLKQADAKRIEICNELDKEEDQANVILWELNLASFESIRKFAKRVKDRFTSIDCLIANAGIFNHPQQATAEGFEMHFGVNHLGHFLLTQLLFDCLKAAKESRVVVVASKVALFGRIHWNNINLTGNYTPSEAYAQSKLANVLFVLELAKRTANTSVTAYAVHPGFVKTEAVDRMYVGCQSCIKRFFTIDSWLGAQTTLYCALEKGIELFSGSYFENCTKSNLSGVDDKQAKDLWTLSLELCNLETDLIDES